MTDLVDGLRITLSGGDAPHLARDALVITAFGAAALPATTPVISRQRTWTLRRLHPALEG